MPDYLGDELHTFLENKSLEFLSNGMSEDDIIKKLSENVIRSTIRKATDNYANDMFASYKEKMYEITLEEQAKLQRFLGHNEQIWGKCFAASQTMYVMAVSFAEDFSNFVSEKVKDGDFKDKQYIYLVLQYIHGRACQEYLEILYLLRLGFADCAFSRWRSLYELSCLAIFISEQPERIAKQYLEQSFNSKPAQSLKESYKWAIGAVDKAGNELKVNSFKTIQDFAATNNQWNEVWNSQYHLANAVTHGSPEGTFGRLANGGSYNTIIVGHSDYGIAYAAENSAISLNMITAIFVTIYPHMDSIANVNTLFKWVKLILDMYHDTTEQSFDNTQKEVNRHGN